MRVDAVVRSFDSVSHITSLTLEWLVLIRMLIERASIFGRLSSLGQKPIIIRSIGLRVVDEYDEHYDVRTLNQLCESKIRSYSQAALVYQSACDRKLRGCIKSGFRARSWVVSVSVSSIINFEPVQQNACSLEHSVEWCMSNHRTRCSPCFGTYVIQRRRIDYHPNKNAYEPRNHVITNPSYCEDKMYLAIDYVTDTCILISPTWYTNMHNCISSSPHDGHPGLYESIRCMRSILHGSLIILQQNVTSCSSV